ncbi:MAG: tetratricopeptide repeat protein [Ardenticatenales bacterium]
MYSVYASLGAAAAASLAAWQLSHRWWVALIAGLVATVAVFGGISYWVRQQLNQRMPPIEQAVQGQRVEQALKLLEGLRVLGRWQLGLNAVVDGQIGVITYATKMDFDHAQPYLERAVVKNWHAKAMLAALHYKARRFDDANRVFEEAVRFNKKEAMLWAAYAWCESRRQNRAKAIEILQRALKALPNNADLKDNLSSLQQDKKLKMNAYTPEWWALHLERPPAKVLMADQRQQLRVRQMRRMRS